MSKALAALTVQKKEMETRHAAWKPKLLELYVRGMDGSARLKKYLGMGYSMYISWDSSTSTVKQEHMGQALTDSIPDIHPAMRTDYAIFRRIRNAALDVPELPCAMEERRASFDKATGCASGKLNHVTVKYRTEEQLEAFVRIIGLKSIRHQGGAHDGTWYAHVIID